MISVVNKTAAIKVYVHYRPHLWLCHSFWTNVYHVHYYGSIPYSLLPMADVVHLALVVILSNLILYCYYYWDSFCNCLRWVVFSCDAQQVLIEMFIFVCNCSASEQLNNYDYQGSILRVSVSVSVAENLSLTGLFFHGHRGRLGKLV